MNMIDVFRHSRREVLPSTPLLDEIDVTTLREDPDLLEKLIVGQHQQAASNESVADLLRSIFLLPDRDADFGRFAKSVEFATILRLLQTFGVARDHTLIEIGGG